jgi:hypothetical protein
MVHYVLVVSKHLGPVGRPGLRCIPPLPVSRISCCSILTHMTWRRKPDVTVEVVEEIRMPEKHAKRITIAPNDLDILVDKD